MQIHTQSYLPMPRKSLYVSTCVHLIDALDSRLNLSQWPGYDTWHYVVHVYDHSYDSKPITLARLSKEVAKAFAQMKAVSSRL